MKITNEQKKHIKKEPLFDVTPQKKVVGKFIDKDNRMIYIIKDGKNTYTDFAENIFRTGFRLKFKPPKVIKIK